MPDYPPIVATTVPHPATTPLRKLEPDAISASQDVIIGMASSAPAASIGLTLPALVAATAYGSGAVIVLTALPMLVIANAYRRLNPTGTGANLAIGTAVGVIMLVIAVAGIKLTARTQVAMAFIEYSLLIASADPREPSGRRRGSVREGPRPHPHG